MTTRNRFIMGFAAGAAIGTAAALLVAPKSGKETRQVVAEGAGKLRQNTRQYWGPIRHKIDQAKGNGGGRVSADQQLEAQD